MYLLWIYSEWLNHEHITLPNNDRTWNCKGKAIFLAITKYIWQKHGIYRQVWGEMSGSCIIQRRENIYDVSAHGKVWRMHDCVYKGIYIYIYGAKQLVV